MRNEMPVAEGIVDRPDLHDVYRTRIFRLLTPVRDNSENAGLAEPTAAEKVAEILTGQRRAIVLQQDRKITVLR